MHQLLRTLFFFFFFLCMQIKLVLKLDIEFFFRFYTLSPLIPPYHSLVKKLSLSQENECSAAEMWPHWTTSMFSAGIIVASAVKYIFRENKDTIWLVLLNECDIGKWSCIQGFFLSSTFSSVKTMKLSIFHALGRFIYNLYPHWQGRENKRKKNYRFPRMQSTSLVSLSMRLLTADD